MDPEQTAPIGLEGRCVCGGGGGGERGKSHCNSYFGGLHDLGVLILNIILKNLRNFKS